VARVRLGIESSAADRGPSEPGLVAEEPKAVPGEQEFVAFALISEANQIDQRYTKNLSFRLCMGKEGYEEYGVAADQLAVNFSEPENGVRLNGEMPVILPINKVKPCVSLCFFMQDLREVMFRKNLIRNCLNKIVSKNIRFCIKKIMVNYFNKSF